MAERETKGYRRNEHDKWAQHLFDFLACPVVNWTELATIYSWEKKRFQIDSTQVQYRIDYKSQRQRQTPLYRSSQRSYRFWFEDKTIKNGLPYSEDTVGVSFIRFIFDKSDIVNILCDKLSAVIWK